VRPPGAPVRGHRTGDTWDFEFEHLALVNPGTRSYIDTACLSEGSSTDGRNLRFEFA
jgi:hypothetical protein